MKSILSTREEGPRKIASLVLSRVLDGGAYADIALASSLSRSTLNPADRALATEIVYGTLRRLLTIDWTLNHLLKKGLAHTSRDVAMVLRAGAYQLMFLTRMPAYAVIDEAVEIAKRSGGSAAGSLVNAVLRRIARDGPAPLPPGEGAEKLSVEFSHPVWIINELLRYYGDRTKAILEANNAAPALNARVNNLRAGRDMVAARLDAAGIEWRPCRYAPDGIVLSQARDLDPSGITREGLLSVMDEAAMLVSPAVSPCPGDRVLDACAAPGGKTAHLASLMDNSGSITAWDINESRLKMIADNCQTLGVTNVTTQLVDASLSGSGRGELFDCVLLDAPCSGLGVMRRRPDLRWRKDISDVRRLSEIQLGILANVAGRVKPGGTLVYSTCSIHPMENSGTVQAFLSERDDFMLDSLVDHLPDGLLPGDSDGMIQLLTSVHGTDGFFIARMKRKEGSR